MAAGYIQIGDDLRFIGDLAKGEFIQAWQQAGNTGVALVPRDEDACGRALTPTTSIETKPIRCFRSWQPVELRTNSYKGR